MVCSSLVWISTAWSQSTEAVSSPQPVPQITDAQTPYADLIARSKALTPAQSEQARKLFNTGFTLWQSGDFESAELGFKDGLEIDPANAPANFYYADCLLKKKDKTGAKEYLAHAAALGAGTAEGLKARVQLKQLLSAPKEISEMTPEEISKALVGEWKITFGISHEYNFTIESISGNKINCSRNDHLAPEKGTIVGDEINLVWESWTGSFYYKGKLSGPDRIEGQLYTNGAKVNFIAERQH